MSPNSNVIKQQQVRSPQTFSLPLQQNCIDASRRYLAVNMLPEGIPYWHYPRTRDTVSRWSSIGVYQISCEARGDT
jgi:hypothetical protein